MAVMSDFEYEYELDNQVHYPVPPSVFEEVRYFIYKIISKPITRDRNKAIKKSPGKLLNFW